MNNFFVYFFKRLGHVIVILLCLSFITMTFIRLIPGDPVRMSLGPTASEEIVQRMRSEMHFDKPLPVQYFYWFKDVITEGDFGQSLFTKRAVSIDIAEFLPRSLELIFFSAILILFFGVLLGTVSALMKNSFTDNIIRFLTYLGVVTPPYAFAVFFMLLFAFTWKIFPLGGMPDFPDEMVVTGMLGIDSLIAGDFKLFGETIRHLMLPAVSLSIGSIAYQARMHRSALLEHMNADYISFARVTGIRERTVIMKHLMKPSFIPSLTIFGLQVASLLGNAFLIEVIFRYPGFSQYSLNVIMTKDPYGIVAVTFIFGLVFAVVNFLLDIGLAKLDPRTRLKTSE